MATPKKRSRVSDTVMDRPKTSVMDDLLANVAPEVEVLAPPVEAPTIIPAPLGLGEVTPGLGTPQGLGSALGLGAIPTTGLAAPIMAGLGQALGRMAGPGLGRLPEARRIHAEHMVRKVYLVLPPAPKALPQAPRWWMDAMEYRSCFDDGLEGKQGSFCPSDSVDIDWASRSMAKVGWSERLWAQSFVHDDELLGVGFDPKMDLDMANDGDLWRRMTNRQAEMRDQLMDTPAQLFDFSLARTGRLEPIAKWAGLNLRELTGVTVGDIVDREGEPHYRTRGLLAAAVDYIIWLHPQKFYGGADLVAWRKQLTRKPMLWYDPHDIFIWHTFYPHPLDIEESGVGKIAYMRGEYAVRDVTYVSALGTLFEKAPPGVVGWRHCELTMLMPMGLPKHTCSVDCDTPWNIGCKDRDLMMMDPDSICTTCGEEDCGEHS